MSALVQIPFPSYRGDEPYIFVCYSHEDSGVVFAELDRLHELGVNIYYDEGISPGDEWTQALADAIDGSSAFLFFVSSASVASRHCRNEVQYALDEKKPLVSVHLAPTEMPGGLRLTLGSAQAILKYELSAQDYRRKIDGAFGDLHRTSIRSEATPTKRRALPWARVAFGLAAVVALAITAFWWLQRSETPVGDRVAIEAGPVTLAVLPFLNMSGDPEKEYFSEGISEDILGALARQRDLMVRARGSSFLFKTQDIDPRRIADQLNVRYLVSGSVRTQGKRIRITVRLTDVVANADVWTNRYDRELVDVFAVQDEISASIVKELGAHFTSVQRPMVGIEAYNELLLGRHYYERGAWETAEEHLLRSIDLDATYADPHALLARLYATEAYNSPPNLGELAAKSAMHIAKSLERDPMQPVALGLSAMSLPIEDSITELDALVRRHPNDDAVLFFYGSKLRQIGRFDLQLAVQDRIVALDPLSGIQLQARAHAQLGAGRLDLARHDAERAEQLGFPMAIFLLQIALLEGDLAGARSQGDRPAADWAVVPSFWRPINIAFIAFAEGDVKGVGSALAALRAAPEELPRYPRCLIALLEGETEAALDFFQLALERGEPFAFYEIQGTFLQRKLFPQFYASARYQDILRRFGVDEVSVAMLEIPPLPF